MLFASREDAGEKLGRYLRDQGTAAELVLGLPRGGVVVARSVARVLNLPLGVLLVRKIGHPSFREFAVGAIAENGVLVLDDSLVGKSPALTSELDQVIEEELLRLEQLQTRYHLPGAPAPADKTVLLVDDGLATGSTTEAAVKAARAARARRVIVAAPVASLDAIERLEKVADSVEVFHPDPDFEAVGRYYENFGQTTDDEVLHALHEFGSRPGPSA